MRQYKEHFVAFLDILGFKNLIVNSNCNDIYSIFDEIHSKSNASLNFNGVQIQAYDHIKYKILSDSIIIFIDTQIPDSFSALLDVCSRLQRSLIHRDDPILLRGGISKGLLYYEDDVIYGEGLTNAYLLENNLAKYPRIVFTGETLEAGKKSAEYIYVDGQGIFNTFDTDEDMLYFLHYHIQLQKGMEERKMLCDKVLNKCKKVLNHETNSDVREKYIWLKNYFIKSISMMPELQELYDKEREEEFEKETEEYNKHFYSKFARK